MIMIMYLSQRCCAAAVSCLSHEIGGRSPGTPYYLGNG